MIEPKEHMILVPHINKVNMIALVAGILGGDNVNISGMSVVPFEGEKSIMIINVDTPIEKTTLDKINSTDGIEGAVCVNL